jgi:hypothetical protein
VAGVADDLAVHEGVRAAEDDDARSAAAPGVDDAAASPGVGRARLGGGLEDVGVARSFAERAGDPVARGVVEVDVEGGTLEEAEGIGRRGTDGEEETCRGGGKPRPRPRRRPLRPGPRRRSGCSTAW